MVRQPHLQRHNDEYAGTRRYIVCYDTPSDRRRQALSGLLTTFGVRVQFSVFECVLNDHELRRMTRAIDQAIDADLDNVLILQCAAPGKPSHPHLCRYADRAHNFWLA